MKINNLIMTHKKSLVVSLLSCAIIAASFFTLKSNSFRNMWSLADSNVEALSDVENTGSSFRYDYFYNACQHHGKNLKGEECYTNFCDLGNGLCVVDKFANVYNELDIISIVGGIGANARAWLDSLGDFLQDLPDATLNIIKNIATKFKAGKASKAAEAALAASEIKGIGND